MEEIKVSVVCASYNYENYIKETIESVINQTYSSWEMIIVDDGSKDNSVEVIKSYSKKDDRIKLFTHENNQNKGLIETLKKGIKEASGNWIVFLESDDKIEKNYLEEKIEIIKKYPDIGLIFNDVNMFGDENKIKIYENHRKKINELFNKISFPYDFKKDIVKRNYIWTFSVVMLKKELLEALDFNSFIPQFLDHYLWAQLSTKTKFYYIDKKLTNWRIHSDSYVNVGLSALKSLKFKLILKSIVNNKKPIPFYYWLGAIFPLIKALKRKFLRVRLKEKRIMLFGKWFEW